MGVPWFVGRDLVCAVFEYRRHVGVEFWRGIDLPDPSGLLEGTGKNLRHVKLRAVADATSGPFRRLLRAADRLDRTEPPRRRTTRGAPVAAREGTGNTSGALVGPPP